MKTWVVVLLVAVITTVVVGGFFACKYSLFSTWFGKDEVAGWQTYRNDQYGFEMQYPINWSIVGPIAILDGTVSATRFSFSPPNNPDGTSAIYPIELIITNNNQQLSAQQYVENRIKQDENIEIGPKLSYEKAKPIMIGDNAGYQLTGVFAGDSAMEQIYLTHDGKVLIFSFPVAEPNPNFSIDPVQYNALCHQILSTLKFTEQFSWYGDYRFEEFAPPNQGWMYNLSIYSSNGAVKVYADLNIDGFQTLTRLHATTSGIKDSNSPMDIIFDSYNYKKDEVNLIVNHNYYKKGDVLFTLTPRSDGNLSVTWRKMKPELESNLTTAVFKRISN